MTFVLNAFSMPVFSLKIADLGDSTTMGFYQSLSSTSEQIGRMIAPLLLGILYETSPTLALYTWSAMLVIAGASLAGVTLAPEMGAIETPTSRLKACAFIAALVALAGSASGAALYFSSAVTSPARAHKVVGIGYCRPALGTLTLKQEVCGLTLPACEARCQESSNCAGVSYSKIDQFGHCNGSADVSTQTPGTQSNIPRCVVYTGEQPVTTVQLFPLHNDYYCYKLA